MARKSETLMVPWSTGFDWLGRKDQLRVAGSLLDFAYREPSPDVEWRQNEIFSGTLRLDGVDRKSPGTHRCIWVSPDGRTYPMFVSDLVEMAIKRGVPERGIVHARWTVRRQGQNFGLVAVTS